MLHRTLCATGLFALFSPLAAQSMRTVDDDGPADFTTIQAAIDASSIGDTILVQDGSYPDFTLTKGLILVGIGDADVLTLGGGGFTVENLPVGQSARIVNLGVTALSPLAMASIVVRNNAGTVHLTDLGQPPLGGPLEISNSAFVTLHGSAIHGGVTGGFTIDTSTVQISDCEILGSGSTSAGAPAVVVSSSDVHVASSTFAGSADPLFGAHYPGIQLQSGTLCLGANVSVGAGAGVGAVPAIETAGGLITLDPAVELAAVGGAPDISGPASITTSNLPDTAILEATAGGGALTVRTWAPVGASAVTLIADPGGPLPTPFGDLTLSGALLTLDAGTVSAAGQRTTSVSVSPSTLAGFTLAAQAIVLDASGLRLSVGSTAVFAAP